MDRHIRKLFLNTYDFLYLFGHNKEYLNPLRNNQQSTSMEETKEPPSSLGGEVEKVLHQEDRKSLLSEFDKDDEK